MAVHDPSAGLLFSPSSRYPNPIAYLVDSTGDTVHTWSHSAWQPKPEDDPPGSMRGWNHVEVDAEGNLFAVVPLRALLKLSADSGLVWSCEVAAHHDLAFVGSDVLVLSERPRGVDVDGGSHVVLDNLITRIDEAGVARSEVSLYDVLRTDPTLRAAVDRSVGRRAPECTAVDDLVAGDRLWWTIRRLRSLPGSPCDVLHTNTLEVVDDHPAGLWSAGDVLVCMRELNTVAVVDPVRRAVRWSWGSAELSGPHQPSVMPDGRVLVFDNGVDRGWTRLLIVDPATDKVEWSWSADPPTSFFCPLAGGCEVLANGNILVTHSAAGKAFELSPSGRVGWRLTLPPDVYGTDRGRVSVYRISAVSPSIMRRLASDVDGMDRGAGNTHNRGRSREEEAMRHRAYVAQVGVENAELLAKRSRTAWLASEYRPMDLGDGRISLSEEALGASRELGEEEDGAITDDAEGLRIWVGDDAFELIPEL